MTLMDAMIQRSLGRPDSTNLLRAYATELFERGIPRDTIRQMFDSAREVVVQQERAEDEEALLDVLDIIEGWCSPHVKIAEPTPSIS